MQHEIELVSGPLDGTKRTVEGHPQAVVFPGPAWAEVRYVATERQDRYVHQPPAPDAKG